MTGKTVSVGRGGKVAAPEDIAGRWDDIVSLDHGSEYPDATQALAEMIQPVKSE